MVPLSHVLALSAVLFVIGAAGFVFRKSIITVFMCIELMLNAVNLAFIGFSRYLGSLDGQLFAFFVIVVAAAEAAVGLAIIIAVYRNRDSLNIEDLDSMKF
ncbi:MAG TPA: NADH-quinone oxidoreductase subunit NuoK [Terriglobia bacterium]|nr:NADH-quinone oxidoreductase subunit NuoK [Terriglobia bacterium]